ncbi:MAG: phenylalanine--tRNA ligase subunit beta, partial [Deltaproteobacteria bacterium]
GKEILPVVCGAPNIAEGQNVAFAQIGTKLPSGMEVRKAKIRGETSYGMICSEKELGIGSDHSGILVLDDRFKPGIALAEALDLDDTILEVAITPNRGDCLSYLGIAREVAALTGKKVKYPVIELNENGPPVESLTSVTLLDPIRCPRYSARVIEGVEIKPSPRWLQTKLEAAGLRAINNIVDVTNFVLLEYGQPLHAFDFDLLHEHKIVVRTAEEGERFVTLDGTEHVLDSDMLLICDGEKGVALAGIMGGENSEIQPTTTNVLIESAFFDPYSIRKTSKKLGISTESSYRFERRVDPEGVLKAVDRAAQLMQELGGGRLATGYIDQYPRPFEPVSVTMNTKKASVFLGVPVDVKEAEKLLASIELDVKVLDDDRLAVEVPTFRGDLTREVDLFEEIARLKGYDYIPAATPVAPLDTPKLDEFLVFRNRLADILSGLGFSELVTYSFISEELISKLRFPENDPHYNVVKIKNPLSEEQAVMRTTLLPGLLETVRRNIYRKNEDLRLFELSRVFYPQEGGELPSEPYFLVGAMAGSREATLLYDREKVVDFYEIKGVLEAVFDTLKLTPRFLRENIPPYFDEAEAASVKVGKKVIGHVGLLHPEVAEDYGIKVPVYLFELSVEHLYDISSVAIEFKPLPKFPFVTRDLAVVVEKDIPAQAIIDSLLEAKEPLLESVAIFDVYEGKKLKPNERSIGYRITYRAPDRNLTDEEVNEVHMRLVKRILKQFNARLPE